MSDRRRGEASCRFGRNAAHEAASIVMKRAAASIDRKGESIGSAGLFERLGVGLRLVIGPWPGGYVVRWDQLDISDPERPRLTCGVEELRPLTAPETTKSDRSS